MDLMNNGGTMNKTNYVDSVIEGREEELKRIQKLSQKSEPWEDEDHREPLSVDTTKEVKILLSWGGPEDGFKLRFSNDDELLGGVYYRADWGEYKESDLTDEEADEVFNYYLGGVL